MTPFDDIYNVFLIRVRDYEIIDLDVFNREYMLKDYLFSAVAEFSRIASLGSTTADLLEVDDAEEVFIHDLDKSVIDILVKGMLYFWYCPKVLDAEKFENNFNLKDLPQYSPANLLSQLYTNREYLEESFKHAINKYSFIHGDVEGLRI